MAIQLKMNLTAESAIKVGKTSTKEGKGGKKKSSYQIKRALMFPRQVSDKGEPKCGGVGRERVRDQQAKGTGL